MLKRLFPLLTLLMLFFFSHHGYGQSPLDGYKYIIVPKKFDFLRSENQYRVNSQTKFLLEKNGFQTLLKGEEYPEDLKANPCLAAEANVVDDSNSFTTKLRVAFLNCMDQVVYTSEEGKSKEKDYNKTYAAALNGAFESIGALNYKFNPELVINPVTTRAQETAPVTEPAAVPVVSEPAAVPVVSEPEVVPVVTPVAVPVAATLPEKEESTTTSDGGGANSYGNENLSFFLIDQGDKLSAYVINSNSEAYKKGEMIGTFAKSSLPNVYRVEWKDMDKDIEQTTGYFDEQGNLKIDVKRNGKIEVLTFKKE